MNHVLELGRALWRVIVPTPMQAAAVLALAFWLLVLAKVPAIMARFGITAEGIDTTRASFINALNSILGPSLPANIALVVFWAGVGLVVYLICWWSYNLMIGMRNRVTIETGYLNRGSMVGLILPILFNLISGVALILYLSGFAAGLNQWLAGTAPVVQNVTTSTVILAAAALLGLAIQLYGVLVLIQLTITPWYGKAFTD